VPNESEQFGFKTPLQNSSIFKNDLLGLKTMDDKGQLIFLDHPGMLMCEEQKRQLKISFT
jgi:hypothetical protein